MIVQPNQPNEPRAILATCIASGRRQVRVLPLGEAEARAIQLPQETVTDDCMINLHPIPPDLHEARAAFVKEET